LKTPFRRRRSINTHFSGAGEVLIYTYLAPERPEKPEKPGKYLYTPKTSTVWYYSIIILNCPLMLTKCFDLNVFL